MKYIYPKLLFVCLAVAVYYNNKTEPSKKENRLELENEPVLVVKRGAFNNDRFVLSKTKIQYLPDTMASAEIKKYKLKSETYLDSLAVIGLFKKLSADGFWQLHERYGTTASATSELIVTLNMNGKSKTVICDDFEHDCPEIIKYIDKKVVELVVLDLDRINNPI